MGLTTTKHWWAAALLGGLALAAWGQPPPPAQAIAPVIDLTRGAPVRPLEGASRYWSDSTGTATASEVEARSASLPWATHQLGRRYRIDGQGWWLHFVAQAPVGSRWFVTLGNAGLDRAELHYRGADGGWVTQLAGDIQPVSRWAVPGRVPTLEIAATGAPVAYWLRVAHDRVDLNIPIRLYRHDALLDARETEQFLLGGFFGLAGVIALAALAVAGTWRDRHFAALALYALAMTGAQVVLLGVGSQHLWPEGTRANEVAAFILPGVAAATALWFVQLVTEPARFSRLLQLGCWALIAALLSAVATDAFVASRTSYLLVSAFIGAALVMTLGLIALVWISGDEPHVHLVGLSFVPVVVLAAFPVARALGLLPHSLLTTFGLTLGTVLQFPLLFAALALRVSRRREVTLRAAELPHSDPLTGLADRKLLLARLDDALARARSQRHACALLAVRLSNHDVINAEMGRDTGERALVVTASVLRQSIADIDLAARIGERDFALLLEGPTSAEAALARAQQVVARGLRHADALPPATTLRFHITVALLPERDLDAGSALKWVQDTCNAMRSEARRAIRPMNF